MYGLESGDRYEIKRIAGKGSANVLWYLHARFSGRIVPAIGTTTATVSGLVCTSLVCLSQWHQVFNA